MASTELLTVFAGIDSTRKENMSCRILYDGNTISMVSVALDMCK